MGKPLSINKGIIVYNAIELMYGKKPITGYIGTGVGLNYG